MPTFWRNNAPLIGAVGLSLVAHSFLLAIHLAPSEALGGAAVGGPGGAQLNAEDTKREFMEPDRGRMDNERARKLIEHAKQRRRRLAELPPPLPVDHEEPVRLGVDDSEAQTMNWIGYDEYQEHLAELAEVEQAAFRMQIASGASGTAPTGLPPQLPTLTAAQASEPKPLNTLPGNTSPQAANVKGDETSTALVPTEVVATTSVAEATSAATSEAPTEAVPATAQQPRVEQKASDASTAEVTSPINSVDTPSSLPAEGEHTVPLPPLLDPSSHPSPDQPAVEEIKPVPPTTAPIAEETAEATPAVEPHEPAATSAASSSGTPDSNASPLDSNGGATPAVTPTEATGTQPTPPTPAGKPSEIVSRDGALSDRESDATSIIDVPPNLWKSGRPLAAKGITLKTKRPTFTALNMIDGIGRNPIAELVLGRDGKTMRARLVRSTGNSSADEALVNSLYGWSASGKQVEKLKPGDTLTIRIRLILLAD